MVRIHGRDPTLKQFTMEKILSSAVKAAEKWFLDASACPFEAFYFICKNGVVDVVASPALNATLSAGWTEIVKADPSQTKQVNVNAIMGKVRTMPVL